MKKYSKPQVMAKNAPSGSYAAGCPAKDYDKSCAILNITQWGGKCKKCERSS